MVIGYRLTAAYDGPINVRDFYPSYWENLQRDRRSAENSSGDMDADSEDENHDNQSQSNFSSSNSEVPESSESEPDSSRWNAYLILEEILTR